ncbi:MAG: hypothetical protein OHK0039_15760 [Bacteroidia bacterium]
MQTIQELQQALFVENPQSELDKVINRLLEISLALSEGEDAPYPVDETLDACEELVDEDDDIDADRIERIEDLMTLIDELNDGGDDDFDDEDEE